MSDSKPSTINTDAPKVTRSRPSYVSPTAVPSTHSSTNTSPTHSHRGSNRPSNTFVDTLSTTYSDIDDKYALELLTAAQQQNELLQVFSTTELEILVTDVLKFISINNDEYVTSKGEAATFVGIVLTGTFTVNVTEHIQSTIQPSQLFGETAYFEQALRTADVVCVERGIVCICQFDELTNLLLDGHATIYTKFITMLGNAALRRVRSMIPKNATLDPLSQSVVDRKLVKPSTKIAVQDRTKETLLLGRLKKTADVAAEQLKREKLARQKAEQQKNQNIYYIQHLENSKNKLEHELKESQQKYNDLNTINDTLRKKLEKAQNYLQPFIEENDKERHQWKIRTERYESEANYLQTTIDTLKQQHTDYVHDSNIKYETLHTELIAKKQLFLMTTCAQQWRQSVIQTIYNNKITQLQQQLQQLTETEQQAKQAQFNAEVVLNEQMSRVISEKQILQTTQHQLNSEITRLCSTIEDLKQKCELHTTELIAARQEKEQSDVVFVRERARLVSELQQYEQKSLNKAVQINISSNLVKYFTIRNFVKNWKLRNNLTDVYFRLLHQYNERNELLQHRKSYTKDNTVIVIRPGSCSTVQAGEVTHRGTVQRTAQRLDIKRLPLIVLIDRLNTLTLEIYEIDEILNYELRSLREASNAFFQRNIELTAAQQQFQQQQRQRSVVATTIHSETTHNENINTTNKSATVKLHEKRKSVHSRPNTSDTTQLQKSLLSSQQIRQLPYIRPNTQQSQQQKPIQYQFPTPTKYVQQFMSPNKQNSDTNVYTLHTSPRHQLPEGVQVYPNTSILVLPSHKTQPIKFDVPTGD